MCLLIVCFDFAGWVVCCFDVFWGLDWLVDLLIAFIWFTCLLFVI